MGKSYSTTSDQYGELRISYNRGDLNGSTQWDVHLEYFFEGKDHVFYYIGQVQKNEKKVWEVLSTCDRVKEALTYLKLGTSGIYEKRVPNSPVFKTRLDAATYVAEKYLDSFHKYMKAPLIKLGGYTYWNSTVTPDTQFSIEQSDQGFYVLYKSTPGAEKTPLVRGTSKNTLRAFMKTRQEGEPGYYPTLDKRVLYASLFLWHHNVTLDLASAREVLAEKPVLLLIRAMWLMATTLGDTPLSDYLEQHFENLFPNDNIEDVL